jgi:hypothetical protein
MHIDALGPVFSATFPICEKPEANKTQPRMGAAFCKIGVCKKTRFYISGTSHSPTLSLLFATYVIGGENAGRAARRHRPP